MSRLINMLKMRCNISRLTTPAKYVDDEGMYSPNFQEVYNNIRCHIYYHEIGYGKSELLESGQNMINRYIAIFQKDIDIQNGDRIYCSEFYPYNFYIDIVNPVKNGRIGKLSHYECILNIEKTN